MFSEIDMNASQALVQEQKNLTPWIPSHNLMKQFFAQ
jgi:hypothetical protein